MCAYILIHYETANMGQAEILWNCPWGQSGPGNRGWFNYGVGYANISWVEENPE